MPNEISRNDPLGTSWPGSDTAEGPRTAREFGESAADAARHASAKVQDAGAAAVDGLAGAASSVRQKAGEYLGASAPRVQEFADAAAKRISATADYVRNSDTDRVKADVETMVRNHPGPALIAAAAVGFLLGRALSRD
jgi:ElaB/YqjD/DUF883 family membrane-anchored ribosome-binding protein